MTEAGLSERGLQILSEASHLFAAQGYERTAMRDIAEACGISKALLYHHFKDKDEIYARIALGFTRELQSFVLGQVEGAGAPLDRVRAFMLASAEYFERYRVAWTASTAAFWNDPVLGRAQERTTQRDAYEGLLRRLLSEAVADGAIRPVDVALAGRLILSALNWMHRWYKPGGGMTATEVAAGYYDMIVAGLAAPGNAAEAVRAPGPASGSAQAPTQRKARRRPAPG